MSSWKLRPACTLQHGTPMRVILCTGDQDEDEDSSSAARDSTGTPQESHSNQTRPFKLGTQVLVSRGRARGHEASDDEKGTAAQAKVPPETANANDAEPHRSPQHVSSASQLEDAQAEEASNASGGCSSADDDNQQHRCDQDQEALPPADRLEEQAVSDVESEAVEEHAADDMDTDSAALQDPAQAEMDTDGADQPKVDAAASQDPAQADRETDGPDEPRVDEGAPSTGAATQIHAAGKSSAKTLAQNSDQPLIQPNPKEVVLTDAITAVRGSAARPSAVPRLDESHAVPASQDECFRELFGTQPSQTQPAARLLVPSTVPIDSPQSSVQPVRNAAQAESGTSGLGDLSGRASVAEPVASPDDDMDMDADYAEGGFASYAEQPADMTGLQGRPVSSGPSSLNGDEDIDITSVLLKKSEVEVLESHQDTHFWRPAVLQESVPASPSPDVTASVKWANDASGIAFTRNAFLVRPKPPQEHAVRSLAELQCGSVIDIQKPRGPGFRRAVVICVGSPRMPEHVRRSPYLSAAIERARCRSWLGFIADDGCTYCPLWSGLFHAFAHAAESHSGKRDLS